jgi:hypothetical protein
MSFFREGSFILYFKRRLGAYATVPLLLLLGLCGGMNQNLSAQQSANQTKSIAQSSLKLNPEKEAYLRESINLLVTMSLRGCDDPTTSHHVNLEEGDLYRHRLFVGHSCVTFPNGDNLYFLVHSGHENESIGDLSLAIDQQGRLYKNEGHVCGGLIHFYTTEKGSLETADNFIHNMKSDTDDKPFSLLSEQLNHP